MSSSYEFSYIFGEELGLGLLSGLLSGIPTTLLGIAAYVFMALALYTLARRRGISHAWLSWVPVIQVWVLGSLSDQYRYVVKGEIKSKRKALLVLSLIGAIMSAAMVVLVIVMAVNCFNGAMAGISERAVLEDILGLLFGILGLSLPMLGVSIAYVVVYYMALYDVYTSMDPDNNVLFLVLSIFFSVTTAFFLFFNRNKDKGMPPRRQSQPEYIPQYPQEESWDFGMNE